MKEEVIAKIKEVIIENFEKECGDELEGECFSNNLDYIEDVVWDEFEIDYREVLNEKDLDELEFWFEDARLDMIREVEENFNDMMEIKESFYRSLGV